MGSGVTLYVGVEEGYASTIVPQVVGQPLAQAKGRLWELGLNIGRIDFDEGSISSTRRMPAFIQVPRAEHARRWVRASTCGSRSMTTNSPNTAPRPKSRRRPLPKPGEPKSWPKAIRWPASRLEEALAEPAREMESEAHRTNDDNEGFFD